MRNTTEAGHLLIHYGISQKHAALKIRINKPDQHYLYLSIFWSFLKPQGFALDIWPWHHNKILGFFL